MAENNVFHHEVASGRRFAFGKNWKNYLSVLDEERIAEAERSLAAMLGLETLEGKTFLDIGSGSGLFSLAAMRLGAARVHSFDFDPDSVSCTRELQRRYYPNTANWTSEQASVLDKAYLAKLGQWDIVYSWGVLHHTGDMNSALANIADVVHPGGKLFISIYNDQGLASKGWTFVKRLYNRSRLWRTVVTVLFIPYFVIRPLIGDLLRRKNPLASYTHYRQSRSMSRIHDWIDWLGGYPFEVAKPEDIFAFYRARNFELFQLKTCAGGLGCNEFVFGKR